MKKAIIPTLAAILLTSSTAEAQDAWGYIEDDIDPAARLGVLGANLAINGTVCGITALVEDRNVFKDVGQCLAGATMQYAGMELGVLNSPVLPGIGLRLTETGTSMIYNTLEGNKPIEKLQYQIPIGGLLEINTEEGEVDYYWRYLPWFGALYNIANQHEFSLIDSLNYQTPVFQHKSKIVGDNEFRQTGLTIGNIFYYDPHYPEFKAHEFTHVLQYTRMRPFQLVMPDFLDDLKNRTHLRTGEDLSFVFATLPQTICSLNGESCSRYYWNLIETEAYIMMHGYKELNNVACPE